MSNPIAPNTNQEIIYEFVENPNHYIDELIAKTGDDGEKQKLADIKSWPDYAKTKWILTNEEPNQVQIMGGGGCAAIVVTIVVVSVLVWIWVTEKDDEGKTVRKRIQERQERQKEIEKIVHRAKHKNGVCPDDE